MYHSMQAHYYQARIGPSVNREITKSNLPKKKKKKKGKKRKK